MHILPFGTYTITASASDPVGGGDDFTTTYTGGLELSGGDLENSGKLLDSDVQSDLISDADDAVFDLHSPAQGSPATDLSLWLVTQLSAGTPSQLASDVQSMQLSPDGLLYALSDGTILATSGAAPVASSGVSHVQSFAVEDSGNVYAASGGGMFELPDGWWKSATTPVFQSVTLTVADKSGVRSVQPDPDGTAVDVMFNDGFYYQLQGTPAQQIWTLIAAPKLVVTPQSPTITAGAVLPVTVALVDALGEAALSYTGTVQISVGGGASGTPPDFTFTASDQGMHTFQLTLVAAGPQTISFDDETNQFFGSATVTVNPGAVFSFNIVAPPDVTAGAIATYSITAVDADGNLVPSYDGKVSFLTSDPLVSPPADVTLSSGASTFPATLDTAGDITITAADTSNSSLKGTGDVAVAASSFAKLGVSAFPPVAGVGVPFNVTLTAQDQFGNTVTNLASPETVNLVDQSVSPPEVTSCTIEPDDDGVLTVPVTVSATGTQDFQAIFDLPDQTGLVVPFSVTGAPRTQVTLVPSASTVASGQSVTLTATVVGSGSSPSTQSVTFDDGSVVLGTAKVSTTGVVTIASLSVPAGAGSRRPVAGAGPERDHRRVLRRPG